ncbi:MAG: gliding motility protein GldL [Prevotella sp.]|nr:gliding motility protein GldL [Prevotella sp.]
MTTYSKYNVIYHLQKWMDSVPGQTFLNYAYSWGASIVILGTLFKLTHLPGANFFLFLGMGTEVLVFFLSAFDRPFDKTTDGMELDIHMGEEALESAGVHGEVKMVGEPTVGVNKPADAAMSAPVATPIATPELEEATTNYVEELKRLTETLADVSAQSKRLAHDSEEMENLNRTLTGICKVYEMQLKSASSQIGTIDEINAQTRKMAGQIAELNQIYARMIEAMSAKM